MPLIRWTPSLLESMDEFDDVFKRISPLSNDVTTVYPALDIYQNETSVIVEAQLAGVNPEDVELSVENDILTLQGKLEKTTEIDEDNYYRKEIRKGSFHRSVALPAAVDADKSDAVYENGVLKITIPKEAKKETKTIKIKTTKK
ncbi:MAG: Hsp20/alpha crystallin family protein [Patescibacteria group bacterium]